MQSNHNNAPSTLVAVKVQSYLNFSKNAIKSQRGSLGSLLLERSKLPQFFKECNQITTSWFIMSITAMFKVTSIFQRMQSNHNDYYSVELNEDVQSYLNFSKNAIKSQHRKRKKRLPALACSKLPQFFKECNQITTARNRNARCVWFKVTSIFQRMQSNHNSSTYRLLRMVVQSYLNFSKNAIKSQQRCRKRW